MKNKRAQTDNHSDHNPSLTAPPQATAVHVAAAGLDYGGTPLFQDLDFTIAAGQWTCLLGPSGIGKTTLLRLIAGLVDPWAGSRVRDGSDQPLDGRIAYMAQEDTLLPWLSVAANMEIGPRLRGERPDRAQTLSMLARLGLGDHASARPAALSGGMRQRVMLGRVLLEGRPIVLMDEPFSALDAITRHELQAEAHHLLSGRTVLLVTHDPAEALRLGDQIYVMAGRPAHLGAPLQPPGQAPRAADGAQMARLQARLLAALSKAKGADT